MPSISIIAYHQLMQDAVALGPSVPFAYIFEKLVVGEPLRYSQWATGAAQGILQTCTEYGGCVRFPVFKRFQDGPEV